MKCVVLVFALCAGVLARAPFPSVDPTTLTSYDYHNRYSIPAGKKILAAEEAIINSPSRIYGGSPAGLNEFPYQVGLLSQFRDISGQGICGGSLVSSTRVITAAHCWYDGVNQAWRVTVVLGSFFLFFGGTRINSEEVHMHEDWSPALFRNDIAVIYLPEQVTFSDSISPIGMPRAEDLDDTFAGYEAIASGYGRTEAGITTNQIISHITVPVISNTVCWFAFPGVVQSNNICISAADGKSTCNGDSGGPLVVKKDGRSILVGATQFGSGLGCGIGMPAVFARITSFMDFFQKHGITN